MKFTPLRPKRVVEAVTQSIEGRILDGTLAPGDRLPSEEQLASQLAVGRRAIREALKVLETKGLIDVRMGVGAIVRRNDLDGFLQALTRNVRSYLSTQRADLVHIMELRWLLEGAALRRLIDSPDPARLRRLRKAVEAQRAAHKVNDAQTYQDWHQCFHHEIVEALDNPVIAMVHRQLLALVRDQMERAGTSPAVQERAIRDHGLLLEAVTQGDSQRLQSVLDEHLGNSVTDLDPIEPDARPSSIVQASVG